MQSQSWQHDDDNFWVCSALYSCPPASTWLQICLASDQRASDDYVLYEEVSWSSDLILLLLAETMWQPEKNRPKQGQHLSSLH